jgi:hypothetical protein
MLRGLNVRYECEHLRVIVIKNSNEGIHSRKKVEQASPTSRQNQVNTTTVFVWIRVAVVMSVLGDIAMMGLALLFGLFVGRKWSGCRSELLQEGSCSIVCYRRGRRYMKDKKEIEYPKLVLQSHRCFLAFRSEELPVTQDSNESIVLLECQPPSSSEIKSSFSLSFYTGPFIWRRDEAKEKRRRRARKKKIYFSLSNVLYY